MASIESLTLQKRKARETSPLFSWRELKDRPLWLNEVRAQNIIANQPKRLEIKHNIHPWNVSDSDIGGTSTQAIGRRIRGILPANKMSVFHAKPHLDAWLTDEETMEQGELWQEYDEQLLALRCYLKEEFLTDPSKAASLDTNKDDSIRSMFETQENLSERLAFNEKWNKGNKLARKFAKRDILSATKEKERAIAAQLEKVSKDGERKLFDEVKGYIINQMAIDEQFGGDLDEQIEKAVDSPIVHNFAVDEKSEISSRKLPFNSNTDKSYEKQQKLMISELEELERIAIEAADVGRPGKNKIEKDE